MGSGYKCFPLDGFGAEPWLDLRSARLPSPYNVEYIRAAEALERQRMVPSGGSRPSEKSLPEEGKLQPHFGRWFHGAAAEKPIKTVSGLFRP